MKYIDEFNDPELAKRLLDDIHATVTQPWALMEVCGGQTHSIIRHGIDQLIPDEVEMIHGPGCPVCVTPLELIDKALEIASRPERDLLLVRRHAARAGQRPRPVPDQERGRRRPGRVLAARRAQDRPREPRSRGGVLRHRLRDDRTAQRDDGLPGEAARRPELQHAGLARPGAAGHRGDHAVADLPGAGVPRRRPRVQRDGHRGVPAARRASSRCRSWSPASSRWTSSRASGAPSTSSSAARPYLENAYARAVPPEGNLAAPATCCRTCSRSPTAAGAASASSRTAAGGWRRSIAISMPSTASRSATSTPRSPSVCRSGEVLQGFIKPHECAAFGNECTPRNPLGATMVSSEGACAAYYLYRRLATPPTPRREVASIG